MIYSMVFNRDGSMIATTSKDRKLRVIEPRSAIVIAVSFFFFNFILFVNLLTFSFLYFSDFRKEFVTWEQNVLNQHFWRMEKF